MEVPNIVAYYDTAKITAVKSFIVQAPSVTKFMVIPAIIQPFFDRRRSLKSQLNSRGCFVKTKSDLRCNFVAEQIYKSKNNDILLAPLCRLAQACIINVPTSEASWLTIRSPLAAALGATKLSEREIVRLCWFHLLFKLCITDVLNTSSTSAAAQVRPNS